MEKRSLNSIPLLSRLDIEYLTKAGFSTIESLQLSTPELLLNKMSPFSKDGYYSLDRCRAIINLARGINDFRKKSPFELTNEFFQNKWDDLSDFSKEDPLCSLSLHLFQNYDTGLANFDDTNIFPIDTSDDIDFLTKRAIFLPSVPTLTFQNNKSIIQIDHQYGYDYKNRESGEYQFFCHLPEQEEASEWFWAVKPLLQTGIIQYVPNIVIYKELVDGTVKVVNDKYTIQTNKFTASTKKERLNELGIDSLKISIPVVDDIPLSLLSEITYNETDSFNNFRTFFSKSINGINFNNDKEVIDFELYLEERINKIHSFIRGEQKKLKLKSITNLIETVTMISATLLIFKEQQQLFDYLFGIKAGALGLGIKRLITDSTSYFVKKVDIEGDECWYLWLLKDSSDYYKL